MPFCSFLLTSGFVVGRHDSDKGRPGDRPNCLFGNRPFSSVYNIEPEGRLLEMAPIMSSPEAGPSSYDYTEGASAIDIGNALNNNHRARCDSQYNTYYDADGDGAMFSGPGHSVNPSSVSRMSHLELGRRSSDTWSQTRRKSFDTLSSHKKRRDSRSSQVSRQSGDIVQDESDSLLNLNDDAIESRERRSRRRSLSPPARSSVFENLAHIFGRPGASDGGRRPSISQRSSMSQISRRSRGSENALNRDNEDERWGYSSGEEDSQDGSQHSLNSVRDNASITSSMEYDSEPPSSGEGNQSLPLLNLDPVFGGEARIDMDTTFTLLDLPPPGPPSRQTVYIPDEDNTIRLVGYETILWRACLWRASCILTFGILALVGHWFPYLWLRWVAREKAFIGSRNGFLVVEVCRLIS
jgi:cation-transporting P-type ATPase 13A2